MQLIANCKNAPEDINFTVGKLVDIKVKTTLQQFHGEAIVQLVKNNPVFPSIAMHRLLVCELQQPQPQQQPQQQQQQKSHYMKILSGMIKNLSEHKEKYLAFSLQHLAALEQYRGSMRMLTKIVVKSIGERSFIYIPATLQAHIFHTIFYGSQK